MNDFATVSSTPVSPSFCTMDDDFDDDDDGSQWWIHFPKAINVYFVKYLRFSNRIESNKYSITETN